VPPDSQITAGRHPCHASPFACPHDRPGLSYRAFARSIRDRSAQPLVVSYSPGLPRLCLPIASRSLAVSGSQVRYALLRRLSGRLSYSGSHTLTRFPGFESQRFQKCFSTPGITSSAHGIRRIIDSRMRPRWGYNYMLELSSTPGFPRCRPRQLSPCGPAVFLRPQKPTCRARVALFRYAPRAGLAPAFRHTRSYSHYPAARRFPVAQS
jgi:hypothetical protein